MNFAWPGVLLCFLLLPVFILGYRWMLRRPAPGRVRYSNLELVAAAAAAGRPWRRHAAAGLFFLALAVIVLGAARPAATIPAPVNPAAVILSIDVSGSMATKDVFPTRLEAAQAAAADFVHALPPGARVGLVEFSNRATLLAAPTSDHDRVVEEIQALRVQSSTAIGAGILEAVYALPGRGQFRSALAAGHLPAASETQNLPPAAIVLLSDGGNNAGPAPEDAARVARLLRVTVYTVGLGAPPKPPGDPDAAASIEPLDEPTLQGIAGIAGGTYHRASTATELNSVYARLGHAIHWTRKVTEVSGVAAVIAAALLAGAIGASIRLHPLG